MASSGLQGALILSECASLLVVGVTHRKGRLLRLHVGGLLWLLILRLVIWIWMNLLVSIVFKVVLISRGLALYATTSLRVSVVEVPG